MGVNIEVYRKTLEEFMSENVQLVAVSKIQSVADIQTIYDHGQRDFGENYVQELLEKQPLLPANVRWHFIGHLQSNKVKYIVPFVHLIQSIDSHKLLLEINKQAKKINRKISCLLQVHISGEETKFGFDEKELDTTLEAMNKNPAQFSNVQIDGLMGMASFSDDHEKVRTEMRALKSLFDKYKSKQIANCLFSVLSLGMSGDYKIAIEEGSNMVRIGSLLFGARPKK